MYVEIWQITGTICFMMFLLVEVVQAWRQSDDKEHTIKQLLRTVKRLEDELEKNY